MSDALIVHEKNPLNLLELAINKNADITQLKELMDLQERWERNQAKKSFLAALSKFQTLVPVLKKGKTANVKMQNGGYFSYTYADLGSITQAIKEPLNECGLSFRWEFQEENGKMKVKCLVSHLDGHTETTSMEGAADNSGAKNSIQQKGSTHTYLQRYTLIGALGLSTADQDNDGKSNKPVKNNEEPGLTEEEILNQWQQTINQVKTQIELSKMYLSNKKAIDGNKQIQAMMKAKETELKGQPASSNPVNAMP